MNCPRCHAALVTDNQYDIDIDRCPACNGRWLDYDELERLEATVASTPEERRATIEYGERTGELQCPVCDKRMTAFNYRAYNLELDACPDGHGYWLDAGEEGRVRDVIAERVSGLARAVSAEAAWHGFIGGLKRGGGGLFRRR